MMGGFLASSRTVSEVPSIGTFNDRLSAYDDTTGHYTLIIYYDSLTERIKLNRLGWYMLADRSRYTSPMRMDWAGDL